MFLSSSSSSSSSFSRRALLPWAFRRSTCSMSCTNWLAWLICGAAAGAAAAGRAIPNAGQFKEQARMACQSLRLPDLLLQVPKPDSLALNWNWNCFPGAPAPAPLQLLRPSLRRPTLSQPLHCPCPCSSQAQETCALAEEQHGGRGGCSPHGRQCH